MIPFPRVFGLQIPYYCAHLKDSGDPDQTAPHATTASALPLSHLSSLIPLLITSLYKSQPRPAFSVFPSIPKKLNEYGWWCFWWANEKEILGFLSSVDICFYRSYGWTQDRYEAKNNIWLWNSRTWERSLKIQQRVSRSKDISKWRDRKEGSFNTKERDIASKAGDPWRWVIWGHLPFDGR